MQDLFGNRITVEQADLKGGNAIVHVIDTVALPLENTATNGTLPLGPEDEAAETAPEGTEVVASGAASVLASGAALAASLLAAALLA